MKRTNYIAFDKDDVGRYLTDEQQTYLKDLRCTVEIGRREEGRPYFAPVVLDIVAPDAEEMEEIAKQVLERVVAKAFLNSDVVKNVLSIIYDIQAASWLKREDGSK